MKDDGTKTKTDREKAEILNEFFKSVFTNENPGPLPNFDQHGYSSELKDFDIKTEDVKKISNLMSIWQQNPMA